MFQVTDFDTKPDKLIYVYSKISEDAEMKGYFYLRRLAGDNSTIEYEILLKRLFIINRYVQGYNSVLKQPIFSRYNSTVSQQTNGRSEISKLYFNGQPKALSSIINSA